MKVCSVEGCDRKVKGHDLCALHLDRLRKTGSTEKRAREKPVCSVEGCKETLKFAKGFCGVHYGVWMRHGDPLYLEKLRESYKVQEVAGVRICSVKDCGRKAIGQGYCSLHYQRFMIDGTIKKLQKVERVCDVPGCDKPHSGHGYCVKHAHRFVRHGDPLGGQAHDRGDTYKWILDHLGYNKDECLIWPYGKFSTGYGQINIDSRPELVHVVMCTITHGAKPTYRHEAAHSCGNGKLGCVASNHVRWLTPSENQREKLIHGTDSRGEKSWNAKLTEEDVRIVIENISLGKSDYEIAKQFAVSSWTIRNIRTGRSWNWFTGFEREERRSSI